MICAYITYIITQTAKPGPNEARTTSNNSNNSTHLHVFEDAEDFAGLVRVARGLHELFRQLHLGRGDDFLQAVAVHVELVLHQHGDVRESDAHFRVHVRLQQGVVLLQHGDGALQGTDGLQQVLLLAVELGQLLLAQRGGLVQGSLVSGDLLLQVLDLGAQLRRLAAAFLDGGGQLGDALFSLFDGLGLLGIVGLAWELCDFMGMHTQEKGFFLHYELFCADLKR